MKKDITFNYMIIFAYFVLSLCLSISPLCPCFHVCRNPPLTKHWKIFPDVSSISVAFCIHDIRETYLFGTANHLCFLSFLGLRQNIYYPTL